MPKRLPAAPKEARPPLPEFAPVPRRFRHDGWTPERQRAFIAALADTGCVDRAARMVNIAQVNCYALRRAAGAEGFRRAWDAALDLGVKRLKDIAFQRAIEGELVPVFAGGKLMGYRRKYNDKLLMFCLRHYGQDGEGRRTTINYFSTRASAEAVSGSGGEAGAGAGGGAGAGAGAAVGAGAAGARGGVASSSAASSIGASAGAMAGAQLSATTLRTVITGPAGGGAASGQQRDDAAAALLGGFAGVPLDAQAQAQIMAALEDCAARARAVADATGDAAIAAALDDPDEPFVRIGADRAIAHGVLVPPMGLEEHEPFREGEAPWRLAGAEWPDWAPAEAEAEGEAGDSA
ncbi:hypothetical protein [Sphingobium nicotianae]|uniref:Terminase n=1 Tax=Sphingobium nicotianae TaxID=2782607 RepID=A0A9X1DFE8_9SPHN|nr:hypothetical protein [Sphingobium nicotianae]MBT2188990.1 hypothetical protein [Sphingobium nicotianae]